MSFRKRGVVLGNPRTPAVAKVEKSLPAGTRPSPHDGRLTTSSGTQSLDQLLAGHAGLPMGTSLLIEETGTTDFGGMLLRYYAAEGLAQGHHVHVLGFDDSWRRELPGLGSEAKEKAAKPESSSDSKMKIAWRYETLGNRVSPSREPTQPVSSQQSASSAFCHTFNLTKKLESRDIKGQLFGFPIINVNAASQSTGFFREFLNSVAAKLASTPSSTIHRVVVPSLLSPTLYPSYGCNPQQVLQFLHGLRGLLRQHHTRLTAIATLPISLHPRANGLTRWAEILCDGVLELVPLGHQIQVSRDPTSEDKAQGLLRVHSLPIFHERGGGLDEGWRREDLSFKLSASTGLIITPYSLPPVGEEEEQAKEAAEAEKKKKSLEF
ncbi:PAXNEB protein superfamily [Cordyceps fumosorosea ARSEF 2679]|uniref:Elongator complex protein 4 n=1 Tax=Cordyceps fumosorosea (strain ARSEF 2679) TaxID=1081104 RepID=A0A167NW41_CORFA|nr:PAXNEB protein superfamily [Cordyceps fumosorosea ARSEF 2679]OAA56006.1 PAXNEB protein superfamily [Cordyceps fumosorosea ARSEF 2679]